MDREPNMNLIRNLLSRPSTDMFTVNCLKILIKDPDSSAHVAELLSSLMDKLIQSGDLLPIHCKQKRPAQRYVFELKTLMCCQILQALLYEDETYEKSFRCVLRTTGKKMTLLQTHRLL